MAAADELRSDFLRLYRAEPRIFRAPGRVNLIGEHTDYNGGFVMPAAIGFATRAAIASRSDRVIEVYSKNYSESIAFDLDEANPAPRGHWSDYVRGVCLMFERSGRRLSGANLVIDSEVPAGAGLSSSAALEVATAFALRGNSFLEVGLTELALLCQRAENEFVGARTGIMDQFAACYGRADHALLLDCRSLERNYEPVADRVKLVICDTRVRHSLAAGEYNLRRAQCEMGVASLVKVIPGVRSLRDVSLTQLIEYRPALDPVIYRRCRHVIAESVRVLDAANALQRADLAEFGRLMIESHRSLRDDFEVSSEELDIMVERAIEAAREEPGVYGARMTGGGFGGCTINLVESECAPEFARTISRNYERKTGRAGAVYVCSPADGAQEEQI
jgi:galactokinase